MELIFSTAALIVLCFVLVARKVLITHQPPVFWLLLRSARTASRLPLQNSPPQKTGWGVGKILGGDIARTGDPN